MQTPDFTKTVYYIDPRTTQLVTATTADIDALTLAELAKSWAKTVMTGQGEKPVFFASGKTVFQWRSGASQAGAIRHYDSEEEAKIQVLEWALHDFYHNDASGCYFDSKEEAEEHLAAEQQEMREAGLI